MGKKLLTHIECFHTGGGIISYFAKFNNEVWLAGDLDNYFGSYDAPHDIVDNDFMVRDIPYESHAKSPSIPFPTWGDILNSIASSKRFSHMYWDALRVINKWHPDMHEMCMEDDNWKNRQPQKQSTKLPISDNSDQLDVLAQIIEVFEDFLDEKCIDIENDEKDDAIADGEDPESISNIYGCDYGDLEDALRPILTRLGVFTNEEEDE